MKLICVCFEMLYPANTGGRIYSFMKLKYLSKNNDIYLFSNIDYDEEKEYRDELLKYCKEVHLYNRNDHKLKNLLMSLRYPYTFASRCNSEMKKDLEDCFVKNGIDFVLMDMPQTLGCLSPIVLKSKRIVLLQQNIEFVALENIGQSFKNPLKRFIYKFDAHRLKKVETKFYNSDVICLQTFVSLEDKAFFEATFKNKETMLLQIGSELTEYKEIVGGDNIMYFGKMSYPPNVEAAEWFALNVFSKIKKEIPQAKYYIVGKDPSAELRSLQDENVIVTGTVVDVSSYYDNAAIVVVPLFHGGGVKVKIMEALGRGKLVLTTKKGIEGTDFKEGNQLIVVKDEEDFANKCIEALTNPEKFESIRRNGYNYVKDNYSWQMIIDRFEKKLSLINNQIQ